MVKPLRGRVALVAGATRGAGRGIATMLGEAGATVYCSGRSSRAARKKTKRATGFALEGRPETIEETAELVTKAGGEGIAAVTDHTKPEQVEALVARIKKEQGRLDILINDIWGGEDLVEHGKPWEATIEKVRLLIERSIYTHLVTSRYAIPLMIEKRRKKPGLIVEVTDGDGPYYRMSFYYDLVKMTVIRMAFDLAEELREQKVAALTVTPGFLRSEVMLEHFGVAEENWRDGAKKDRHFLQSETPWYVGRGIAALAADPKIMDKSGRVFASWTLMREYGFSDRDGSQPDWGKYFSRSKDPDIAKFRAQFKASGQRYLKGFGS